VTIPRIISISFSLRAISPITRAAIPGTIGSERGTAMRKWILGAMAAVATSTNVGCILPIYDGDQAIRTQQLMHTSENLRMMKEEWHRFWFVDQPDHMTPLHTHGGVL